MIHKKWRALFHPERYHGWGRRKRFFEGWYYKLISANEKQVFALIPGIAMDNEGNKQAFIQILDGKKQTAEYFKFPVSKFISQSETFQTEIAGNIFTAKSIHLQMDHTLGELFFEDLFPWPGKWYSPGIMGPYSFVPFMECYHGILSMDHKIIGQLEIGGQLMDFTGGRGYMEKDWGHSFPKAYIWMQCNHFGNVGTSIKVSVAKIPWLGSSFVGFIAGLVFNKNLIQFTSYNSSRLTQSVVGKQKVELKLENKKYQLEIIAYRNKSTELASPISGFMNGRISESMTASIEVKLVDRKNGQILFADGGRNAALEVAGAIDLITILA